MCGRYALSATAAELIEHFRLLSCPEFRLRFNIALQSSIPVIRQMPGTGRVGQLDLFDAQLAAMKNSL